MAVSLAVVVFITGCLVPQPAFGGWRLPAACICVVQARARSAGPFNRYPNISISVKLLMDLRTEYIEKLSQLS